MRRVFAFVLALATAASLGSAFAVSDGNYSPAAMHCSGSANDSHVKTTVEEGCHNATVTVSDVDGHEYFGIGSPQTVIDEEGIVPGVLPFGLFSNVHEVDYWYDFGSGCTRYVVDLKAPDAPDAGSCPWFELGAPNYYGPPVAPNPASGLRIYFGLDDNTAGGEHDASPLIGNGPSDGGGMHVVLDPESIGPWLASIVYTNPQYVATHPLPAGDAGIGFCADGICFSLQTQQKVAYQGGGSGSHDVSNYDGKNWDPDDCSGETDGAACDDPDTTESEDITYWHNQEGTTYAEPGVQIYEDPDAQASPAGPYPLPALYIGTCGVVIGGGDFVFPPSAYTNSAGQIVIPTAC
jgi:hypothetical protein